MARGRMLNNSVCASLKFHDLPDDTCRLMATWLISLLDYRGVFYADPMMVKSAVFPRRADITLDQVAGYLDAMEGAGLIERFQANGDTWQYWPGFAHNQIGLRADREKTNYPPVDGRVKVPVLPPALPQDDGKKPETIRQDDGKVPAEEKLKEVQAKENRNEDAPSALPAAPSPPPEPSKLPRKAKAQPLTPGAQEFLCLFSAKRFANRAQRDAVLALEQDHPQNFSAAATWAAEKGMSRGQAIAAMRKALPKWGKPKKGKPKNDGAHSGILEWMEEQGVTAEVLGA